MECKHAYFADGINYVLCDVDGKAKPATLKEAAPLMCQHQKFCPQIRRCALLSSWIECQKLKPVEVSVPRNENQEVIVTAAPVVKKRRTSKKS